MIEKEKSISHNDWYAEGLSFFINGQYEESIKCFNKILEFDSNHIFAWVSKGDSYHVIWTIVRPIR